MALIRQGLFIVCFFGFSAFWAVVIRLGILITNSQEWAQKRLQDWALVTVRLLKRIAAIDVVIGGKENVPQGACIFVSRHESFFDTLVFFIISAQSCYVIKQELLRVPLYGYICSFVGMIAIDRNGGSATLRKMTKEIVETLDAERPVVIFPQSTREKSGVRGEYSRSIGGAYRQKKVPIVPVALSTGKSWDKRGVYSGTTIRVHILPHVLPDALTSANFETLVVDPIERASAALRNLDFGP